MKIKFNKENISKSIGIEFSCDINCLAYMQRLIDDLCKHNKNYTNSQNYIITNLKELIDNIEILKEVEGNEK